MPIDPTTLGSTPWTARRAVSDDAPLPDRFDAEAMRRRVWTQDVRWIFEWNTHHPELARNDDETMERLAEMTRRANRMTDQDLWLCWYRERNRPGGPRH